MYAWNRLYNLVRDDITPPARQNSSLTSRSSVASPSETQTPSSDLIAADKLWPSHRDCLNVYFMNGSTEEKSLVKNLVRTHYNSLPMRIHFHFLSEGKLHRSDIRVKFAHDSWSYIGTDAELYPGRKTMCLNMYPRRSTEAEIRTKIQADILHEFGHALGMVHAHKHPDCQMTWNYKRLMWSNDWPLKWVREAYDDDTSSVVGKRWDLPYDPLSIMHYAIEKGDTINCVTETPENTVLST
ncbi:hypothetical protein RRF57_011977 [Xylaria bambusicola]|uniref:Peptidase M12A domain-containing protein n=1 Tax=Xylaria bambusicola TaxID=326684 RepID=A0AAN7UNR7_9PEZI